MSTYKYVCVSFNDVPEDQFIYLLLEKLFIVSKQQWNPIWGLQLLNKIFGIRLDFKSQMMRPN